MLEKENNNFGHFCIALFIVALIIGFTLYKHTPKTSGKIDKDMTILSDYTETEVEPEKTTPKVKTSKNHIDMDIVAFLESTNNPNAYNKKSGARGLCQIKEDTWNECIKRMKVDWDYWQCWNNAGKSKRVGNFYMNKRIPYMLKYYGLTDYPAMRLICYNWGIGKVLTAREKKDNLSDVLHEDTIKYIDDYKTLKEEKNKQVAKY
jgi:hypothetical protein